MAAIQRRGGRRRTVSEINMVPFIDVMLVLLIIFMVSAPLITTGVVDLPTVGKSRQQPAHVIEVIVTKEESLRLRIDNKEAGTVSLKALSARAAELQEGNAESPVVISAEKSVRYEAVVRVMDTLQKAGVQRVGLSVKSGS
jgi:biopolymer transport protein TolR